MSALSCLEHFKPSHCSCCYCGTHSSSWLVIILFYVMLIVVLHRYYSTFYCTYSYTQSMHLYCSSIPRCPMIPKETSSRGVILPFLHATRTTLCIFPKPLAYALATLTIDFRAPTSLHNHHLFCLAPIGCWKSKSAAILIFVPQVVAASLNC